MSISWVNIKKMYNKRKFNTQSEESTQSEENDEIKTNFIQNITPKKHKFNNYSTAAHKMMEKMGFSGQTGLGKKEQGIIHPIEAYNQPGRSGFGLKLNEFDEIANKWTPNLEIINLKENVKFIYNCFDDVELKDYNEIKFWMTIGVKKFTIDDETLFCDSNILKNLLTSKNIFDKLNLKDVISARKRSNPFETIGKSIFMNRSAVKMANIDSLFDYIFTKPVDVNNIPILNDKETLYFADVCAGPGGFSEYVLWRKKWKAKGFGFTLKCENDFKMEKITTNHPNSFDIFYGIKNDGNIYDPDNIVSFTEHVLKQTTVGVHFMMSDGGFSVDGRENIQEILSKRLYLCQCLTALSIIRTNGHYITKFFDTFTPFSVGLIYLMYICFKKICIVKPNTSRPANSERYLICKWKKQNTEAIRKYLFELNLFFKKNVDTDKDVIEIVPLEIIRKDKMFFNYIVDSNNEIGEKQITALTKIVYYNKNKNLKDVRQKEIKNKLLNTWNIPVY